MCTSCGSDICTCDLDTSLVPSIKGQTGDIGLTGATGPIGSRGIGADSSVNKLYYKHIYPTDGASAIISLVNFQSALLSPNAYDKGDGTFENNVFVNESMGVSSLSIYVLGNISIYNGKYYNITNIIDFPGDDIKYSKSEISINFTEASILVSTTDKEVIATGTMEFHIVIFG